MASFQVNLKKVVDDSYEIEIGYDLSGHLVRDIPSLLGDKIRKFAVITDTNVEELYAKPVADKLISCGFQAELFTFEAGEKSKTRRTKAALEDAMLGKGFRRDCCVIAVGGGVVTDLAGFLAGTFGRGVPLINYATTLLAAADASVGGKTAVDTPLATNLIGMFYQPKKVYIDLTAWKTLPKRQISSGMAETIKHACLADASFFSRLESEIGDIMELSPEACEYMAQMNCRIKYQIVMKDERESGLREVLNLGHTVGRAVETASDYRLLHGEAVSIGLMAACRLSRDMGLMTAEEGIRVEHLLKRAGLPVRIPDYIDRDLLVQKLYTDKKVRGGKLRFVLPERIGKIALFEENNYAFPVSEEKAQRIIYDL